MEPLAHLLNSIHGRMSVLHVTICLVAICPVAVCRVARWVLHALAVGVANGERVNQTNNQLVAGSANLLDELNVGGGLWDEAEEGLVEMVFGCFGGNNGNARATMTTMPSAAASVLSADRNNNQQATGASERGERMRRRQ